MKIVIIGGGPAGMMAAISAKKADRQREVILLEKNHHLGKKLLITGKGRCNITSSLDISEFISNIPGNGMFLYSAFQNYDNTNIIHFLEKSGVPVKEERGNRIFPVSDKAQDVLKAFERKLKQLGVKIQHDAEVTKLMKDNQGFIVKINGKEGMRADKVIIATGGASYTATGSTGDGYTFAKQLGHTVMPIKASLVPLEIQQQDACKQMQGLSLRNVAITVKDIEHGKTIYEDFGEMVFTHFGVSGPIILSASSHIIRYTNIERLLAEGKIKLYIDLKPALTAEKVDLRIRRDFEEFHKKEFKNALDKLLPQKLIHYVVEASGIDKHKKVDDITREERSYIVHLLKQMEFTIKCTRPVEEGIITAGGVYVKEINPSTMESKIVPGLYFAGEVIDVDAYTGGFNLQIAYSTGYTAGLLG